MRTEVTAGLGAAVEDLVLELGHAHPATHGALRLHLQLDGEIVTAAEPVVGYVHRGAEKLFEVRDYRQLLVLANRHDWLSAFSNELGIALAVERMLGMAVPERATWLRTALAELNRMLSATVFLGLPGPREAVQQVLEEATGGRLHFVANQVGGLKQDVPDGWPDRVRAALAVVRAGLPRPDDRGSGVGVLTRADCLSYGVSGPVARASGLDVDLRRDDAYLAYGDLSFPVVTATAGDVAARRRCLLEQVPVSLDLVEQCLARLPAGPVQLRLPKQVRPPEGETYAWTENPLGAMGYYLVSRGQPTPWRLAMRTASYNNVSALSAVLPGVQLAHVAKVVASFLFVLGDVDK